MTSRTGDYSGLCGHSGEEARKRSQFAGNICSESGATTDEHPTEFRPLPELDGHVFENSYCFKFEGEALLGVDLLRDFIKTTDEEMLENRLKTESTFWTK